MNILPATLALLQRAIEGAQTTADLALAFAKRAGGGSVFADAPLSGNGTSGNHLKLLSTGPGSLPFSFANKPSIPDSRDEEFEGTAYSGWTKTGVFDAGAIDVTNTTFSTASGWRGDWSVARPGWLLIQPSSTSSFAAGIQKAVTLGTNEFIYARVAWLNRQIGGAAFNSDISFGLSDGTVNNHIQCWANYTGGSTFSLEVTTGGVQVNTNQAWAASLVPPSYIGLHKLGTTYRFYASMDGITWILIASSTHATAMTTLFVVANNSSTSSPPGITVMGLDFIRLAPNAATLLP